MVPRVQQVIRQTKARIYQGDARSAGKIVSIFEPSAEVIRKGQAAKLTEFGKLVKLQEAENQIIIDYEVYAQRPHDANLLIPAIEIHAAKLGRVPRRVAADAGFYSGQNQATAKAKGVKRVCIPNHATNRPLRRCPARHIAARCQSAPSSCRTNRPHQVAVIKRTARWLPVIAKGAVAHR
jgi:IS5 family transposase